MIALTGANGQLGRLVIDHLNKTGADNVRALVRSPDKAQDLASASVSRRRSRLRPAGNPRLRTGRSRQVAAHFRQRNRPARTPAQGGDRRGEGGGRFLHCLYEHPECRYFADDPCEGTPGDRSRTECLRYRACPSAQWLVSGKLCRNGRIGAGTWRGGRQCR